MSNDNKQGTVRMSIVYLLLGMMFIVVFVRVVYLKTGERKEFWTKQEQKRIIKERVVSAKRGNIYAMDPDNGEYLLLATTEPQYDVYIDLGKSLEFDKESKHKVKQWVILQEDFNKNMNALCDSLAKVFQTGRDCKSAAEYKRYFLKARKAERRYVTVRRKVSEKELERMKRFPLIGYQRFKRKKPTGKYDFVGAVHVEKGSKRVYPYYPMARRTIGINVTDNGCDTCYNGIDGAFTQYLSGVHGKRLEIKINPNEWVPVNTDEKIKTIDGMDVVTTLDVSLQELAENSLRSCLDSSEAESGCVVLMEVETGYIKAISNLSLNKNGEYVESDNIAISNSFEPGSTFKIVTAMMLLDRGLADTSDLVPTGVKNFPGNEKPIRDVGGTNHGLVSFARALEMSSNVGISQLVYNIYNKKRADFSKDLKEYFAFEPLGLNIKVHEPKPKIGSSENPTDLLRMSFGYVSRMTPLQILTFYNAIANKGVMVKPQFVQSVVKDGKEVERFAPIIMSEAICKRETIDKLHNVLKGVVQNGTGRRLKTASYGIAGKSGTAEIGYDKKHAGIQHRASFVGYFPADAPKYSCIVVISKPQKARTHGGDLAAPVFRELSDRVVGTRIDFNKTNIKESTVKYPVIGYGNGGDFYAFCKSLGLHITKPSVMWVKGKDINGMCALSEQNVQSGIVPNVVGLTIKDAVYMLENLGMEVRFHGKGKVVSQSVAAGSRIDKRNNVIVLGLRSPREEEK